MKAFLRIKDPNVRRRVVDLIDALGEKTQPVILHPDARPLFHLDLPDPRWQKPRVRLPRPERSRSILVACEARDKANVEQRAMI